jgi:hypothetical protein
MAQVFASGQYEEVPEGATSFVVDTLYITDSIYDLRISGDTLYVNDTAFGYAYDVNLWRRVGGKLFPTIPTDDVVSNDSLRVEGGVFLKDNVGLRATTPTKGIIYRNGIRWAHNYNGGAIGSNLFIGRKSGNLTLDTTMVSIYPYEYRGNIGIGDSTLSSLTTGNMNTAVGYGAGKKATTSVALTLLGRWAGKMITTGYENVFVGESAGQEHIDGFYMVGVGTNAFMYSQHNFGGVGIGHNCLSNEQGNRSVGVGYLAGFLHTTGDYSVFIGAESFRRNTTGVENVGLGYLTGYDCITGSRNIFIGNASGWGESRSDKLYIDNAFRDSTNAIVYGDMARRILWLNADVRIKKKLYILDSLRVENVSLFKNTVTAQKPINGTSVSMTDSIATPQVIFSPGDTTVPAVLGKIVYKSSDNHFYGCRNTGAGKKWYQLD